MKRCGEILFQNGKIGKCLQDCNKKHSHQDRSLRQQVRRGEAKFVTPTPDLLLEKFMEQYLVDPNGLDIQAWIPYFKKAIK